MGINSNLSGTDDRMIWLETGIEKTSDDEDDQGISPGFMAKAVTAATENINKLLME